MAQLPPNVTQREDIKIALSLLQHVKARFASDRAVYAEFLDLLKSFSNHKITDAPAVVARAHKLLRGHPDLIQLFDAFTPLPHAEPVREDPPPKRPKRERRQPAAAAGNADCAGPMRFLERVRLAGAGIYDRVLALLFHVDSEKTMDANEIYDRAKEIFGSADSDLLRGFIRYLPTERDFLRRRPKKEPPEEQHRAPAPKRKAAAAARAATPPDAASKKKPRVDDRKATTTNRRASPVVDASKSGEVPAFREAWEFETTYSKLAVTLMRTKKALEELKVKRKEESPEEVEPSPGLQGRSRTFEELYPSRECQDVLREMYGGMLGPIQEALEDGARTELALKTILRRLRQLEQAAVKIAMERRDPARVEAQMKKLAVERVKVLNERVNGEAARDGRGPCAPPAGMWHDAA